eukprot:m51a1_g13639 hypothetical protein (75) ;mRNA; r:12-285
MSQQQTELSPSVEEPWLKSFSVGCGVDAVTGGVYAVSALEPFEIADTSSLSENFINRRIESAESFSSEFSARRS